MKKRVIKFKDDLVDRDAINKIMEAASDLSVADKTSWFYVFLLNRDYINEISNLISDEDIFMNSPFVIAVFSKKGKIDEYTNTIFSLSSMVKKATELNLDYLFTYEINMVLNNPSYTKLKEILGVSDDYTCVGSLLLGYGCDFKEVEEYDNKVFSLVF